jgi:CRISPR-associated protein Csb3
LDIGFSPDAIELETQIFPVVELFAAFGLQYIRPMQDGSNLFLGQWPQPLPIELARIVASNALAVPGIRRRVFRLLGRKARSGVSNAQNDQYRTFTYAHEVI